MPIDFESKRKEYNQGTLDLSECPQDPFVMFDEWMNAAVADKLPEPTAMTLCTTDGSFPSARIVLLKGIRNGGFCFYTNKNSQKGQEIARNPEVALVFHFTEHERQIRIQGRAEALSEEQNNAYFHSRPVKSQIGAVVSNQSSIIVDRSVLQAEMDRLSKLHENSEVPRPKHWGGFTVIPQRIEFWQGRRSRLHDRINYRKLPETGWFMERLAP